MQRSQVSDPQTQTPLGAAGEEPRAERFRDEVPAVITSCRAGQGSGEGATAPRAWRQEIQVSLLTGLNLNSGIHYSGWRSESVDFLIS